MTYLKRGNAYFDGGDLDRGIADWSKAIVIKPDLMRAYYNRCDAYDRKGMRESAVADCRRALELEPDFQPARAALEWLTGPRKGERPLFSN
jgi:tetratricopeptide (TPR) repeat protein